MVAPGLLAFSPGSPAVSAGRPLVLVSVPLAFRAAMTDDDRDALDWGSEAARRAASDWVSAASVLVFALGSTHCHWGGSEVRRHGADGRQDVKQSQ